MMITIFNRKELLLTYDMTLQSKVRDALASANIDYIINPILMSWSLNRCTAEYKFYVKKTDYDAALKVIKTLF